MQITSMICVQVSPECWISQGCLSCSLWKFVCHYWTTTDGTHCMPCCEIILAVNNKLVDLCVWILFVRYQKLKVSCLVVLKDEGTFEHTTEMLCRESRTNPLTWKVIWFYPTGQSFLRLCYRTHLYLTIWHSPDKKTHCNWTCYETCSLLWFYTA